MMARRIPNQVRGHWNGFGVLRSLLVLAGLLLVATAPARAQRLRLPSSTNEEHENGIIDGRVQAVNGRAIPTTVMLRLVTASGEVVEERPATTDGQFEFSNLPHIPYLLTVMADGFETVQQTVDLGRSGGKVTLNLVLQPAPKAPPSIVASETLTDGQASKTARKEFEKAEQAFAKKDFGAARGHLMKAVKGFPCYARAQTELGAILAAQGQTSEAETALKKAIECDPGYADPYLHLGMIYNAQKNFQASVAVLTEGIRHAPSAWQIYYQMGVAKYGLSQFQEAAQDLLKARSFTTPGQEEIQVKLADVYIKEGQFEKAYAEMQAYLTANPQGRFAERVKTIMHQMESSGAVHPAPSLP